MTNEYKLQIGSYGWQYESWNNSFYPEDLPIDWQFAYYANEYSVIMIPWNVLQDNFALVQQGIADSEDSCRILFEYPIHNINASVNDNIQKDLLAFVTTIAQFGTRTLGLVLNFHYNDISNLSNEKLDFLLKLLQLIQSKVAVNIDLHGLSTSDTKLSSSLVAFNAILKQIKIGLCRYNEPGLDFDMDFNSKLQVSFFEQDKSNPKEIRNIVENSLVGECEGSTNVLIFRSTTPNHELMNTALVISDLL